VVLLSTLLLSPAASAAVWQALAAAPQSGGVPVRAATALAEAPRRGDDEDALRAAARGERPLTLRLDLDTLPDSVAVVVSALTVQLVPDEARHAFAPPADALPAPCPCATTPPRAPPA
jgi:hypothetical protein